MTDRIVEHSREMIRVGSKSFFAAARIFDPPTRESAFMLYAWCRYCDDRIDGQELGHGASEAGDGCGLERLEALENETRRALAGESVDHPAFAALRRVVERHRIPERHPLELIEGFRMDVERRAYPDLESTLDYCYHVAGVVGVMMAHVMGVDDEAVLDRASDLGIGFQLTNIARDVMDDAAVDRVYLPGDWLESAGVDDVAEIENRSAVAAVVRRLLEEADRYYESSVAGIRELRPRHAWAIAAAKRVYADIGRVVRARGSRAWDERAVVGKPRKVWLVAAAGLDAWVATRLRKGAASPPREGLYRRPRLESS